MSKRRSHGQFVSEVYSLVGNEYDVLGTYTRLKDKLMIRHNICDYSWDCRPDHFLFSNSRCPRCAGNEKYTTETFKQKVSQLKGNEYAVLGEYESNHKTILVSHQKCGHEWDVLPSNFLRGTNCPNCYGNVPYTTKTFSDKVFQLVNNEYTVLGNYVNAYTKIKMKHSECDHEYEVTPTNFLRGKRCPICASSKGEHAISKILTNKSINFERQYRIDECRNILPLPFDFAVFNASGNLNCLIEFDGIQHFIPSFGEESFNITKRNDLVKNKYCEENNIKLLRIPYFEIDQAEDILSSFLI